MRTHLELKRLPAVLCLGALAALMGTNGCNTAVGPDGTPTACNGLDVTAKAQATVLAYGKACAALEAKAADVEAQWLSVCNAVNTDLGEVATKTSASEACAVLNARVKKALAAGVTVTLDVQASCHADIKAQADCEGKCQVSASCDVAAKCEPGKLVVACNGK